MTTTHADDSIASPSTLRVEPGEGSFDTIFIKNNAAQAMISLYGGQVLSFLPRRTGRELLFVSPRAWYVSGKAIKGGIPVCWPWFGDDPDGLGRPAHGFVRTAIWSMVGSDEVSPSNTRLVLGLRDTEHTRKIWPHAFLLELTIDVSDTLGLTLSTHNTGDIPFQITQALHTYFSVDAIDQASVSGLDGTSYLDKVRDFAADRQAGAIRFDGEVDRIYQRVGHPLQIHDPGGADTIEIDAIGSHTAVVWNPGPAISAAMQDLGDDDYRRFVCVETANAADEVIEVAPGDAYRFGARYRFGA